MSEDKIRKLQQMAAGETEIRAIDKRKLLSWFGAKDHKNLVLRAVDVLELGNDAQDFIIDSIRRMKTFSEYPPPADDDSSGWRKRWLLREFPTGWIVLNMNELLEPLEFEQLKKLQAVLIGYTRVRLEKGEPNRIEACDKCGGSGRRRGDPQRYCESCGGDGQIITFLEMSDEEKALAEGR